MQIPRCWPVLLALFACDGETFSEDVAFARSVSTAGVARVAFETDVGLDVRGSRRVDELTVTGTITLTTTSSETLAKAVEAFALDVQQDSALLSVGLRAPGGTGTDFEQARLSGVLSVQLPDDVDLEAFVVGGGVRAQDMAGDLELRAAGPISVDPAEGDLIMSAGSGGAFVRSLLPGGANVSIQVNAGALELVLPTLLSAQLRAESRAGSILLQHPDLPIRPSGRPYEVTIRGGAARVQALTLNGDILLRN